ncbi:hypothetical protein BC829DRAFT_417600 [Chytridium lagenaria]|nr:hypothetical protein BC829DRAFT_417600 [Chytridium lagenaria]
MDRSHCPRLFRQTIRHSSNINCCPIIDGSNLTCIPSIRTCSFFVIAQPSTTLTPLTPIISIDSNSPISQPQTTRPQLSLTSAIPASTDNASLSRLNNSASPSSLSPTLLGILIASLLLIIAITSFSFFIIYNVVKTLNPMTATALSNVSPIPKTILAAAYSGDAVTVALPSPALRSIAPSPFLQSHAPTQPLFQLNPSSPTSTLSPRPPHHQSIDTAHAPAVPPPPAASNVMNGNTATRTLDMIVEERESDLESLAGSLRRGSEGTLERVGDGEMRLGMEIGWVGNGVGVKGLFVDGESSGRVFGSMERGGSRGAFVDGDSNVSGRVFGSMERGGSKGVFVDGDSNVSGRVFGSMERGGSKGVFVDGDSNVSGRVFGSMERGGSKGAFVDGDSNVSGRVFGSMERGGSRGAFVDGDSNVCLWMEIRMCVYGWGFDVSGRGGSKGVFVDGDSNVSGRVFGSMERGGSKGVFLDGDSNNGMLVGPLPRLWMM